LCDVTPHLHVRLSVRCPPLTLKRKTVQRSSLEERLSTLGITGKAILRSKGQRSRKRQGCISRRPSGWHLLF